MRVAEELTVEAYAQQVGARLREAHAASRGDPSKSAVISGIIAEADDTVARSGLDVATRKLFWRLTLQEFHNGVLMVKAENSALHLLMREIEAALQARQSR